MLNKEQLNWIRTNFNKLAKANEKDKDRKQRYRAIGKKAEQSKGILVIGKTDARGILALAQAMHSNLVEKTIPEYKRRGKGYEEYLDKAKKKAKNLENMVKLIKAKLR